MESAPKSLLDGLRFDIFERVHLSESDRNIELIEETELTPQIKMLMHKDTILLEGKLLLKIRYLGGETPWTDNDFEFSIPVEITIPANRVSDAWLLDADIENFSIEQVGSRSLNVTGVLKIYEKEPVRVDKPLSQEQPKPLGDGIGLFIGMYEGVKTSRLDKKYMLKHLQILLAEVKRLQAIEQHAIKRLKAETRGNSELAAERDRYKEAIDFCISTFQGNEMFIKAEQVKLMIKGVNDHE